MTDSAPATGRPLEAAVYDVNGNKVGTVQEIFGDDTTDPTPIS